MTRVRLTNDRQMIESLRDSDFDCYSAYGEVVDNAIQAGATFCRIRVKIKNVEQRGPRYEHIEEIAFADDGCGMGKDILHNCLSLGWSSRYNDRNGIGRFGVGMTLGAIHEAKRIEVYSKPINGDWQFVYLDLDELKDADVDDLGIAAPVTKSPPSEYQSLLGSNGGTLVLWKKYDRQTDNFLTMLPLMNTWLGRTFRNFIWKNFVIELNGNEVKAIDPLYVTKEKTEFPDDPKAELFLPMTIEWPSGLETGANEKSTIHIRMSFLPEQFRMAAGAGGSTNATARHIDENEGISILRKGREVFYDHIPHWPGGAADERDRWWGCEIDFDPVLDKSFSVKNIKRGAVPTTELKKAIHNKIKNTIKSCREKVSERFKTTQVEKQDDLKNNGKNTGHESAQATAKNTSTPQGQLDKDKDFDREVKALMEKQFTSKTAEEQAALKELFRSQPFTIVDGSWHGPVFIEVSHLGGNDVINYNLRHPFMLHLYEMMNRIKRGETKQNDSEVLRKSIDLLLIAYSKAESMLDSKDLLSPEVFIDTLRTFWGQYLSRYMEQWNKEEKI